MIDQFMWAFQPHFRNGLERAARGVFEQVGFGLGARAFLVGFTDDADREHPICFEPEHDGLAAIDLSSVRAEATRRYDESEESRFFYSSGRHHERIHRALLDSFRAEALADVLAASPQGEGLTFFVGASVLVDGTYEVHPVIAVPTARWESKPALARRKVDGYTVTPSFQHSLMRELLRAATADLGHSTPPEDFSLQWTDRSELVRKAAREFVQSVSLLTGFEFPSELTVALDEVSAQPYEGRAGAGGLLLAAPSNPAVNMSLTFTQPIRLSETRSVRKALEMADARHQLLCDGEKVRGLASLSEAYEPALENAYKFNILARGVWELSHASTPLLRVSNTRPTLPQPRLDGRYFKSVACRVFDGLGPGDANTLWGLAEAASAASHGTMVVVHGDASAEAARLVPQAQQVEAKVMDADLIGAVTNIDGALLVEPNGVCHAVGVILDGHASGEGDPSRGARYNSAVRYHDAHVGNCMVIIVSEDGMIDLLPRLRRQVSREAVEDVVRQVEGAITEDPDYEVFFRHWTHLESLAFYLSAEQCGRANQARTALEDHRARPLATDDPASGLGRVTRVSWNPFAPDTEMNETYFLD